MSVFTWVPQSASLAQKPRVKSAAFGDGYEQRTAFGLNSNPQKWSLGFVFASAAAYQACIAFLVGLNGVTAFDWTPRGESVVRRYKCAEWSAAEEAGGIWRLSASFEQDYGN
jgi:phage-related protein